MHTEISNYIMAVTLFLITVYTPYLGFHNTRSRFLCMYRRKVLTQSLSGRLQDMIWYLLIVVTCVNYELAIETLRLLNFL